MKEEKTLSQRIATHPRFTPGQGEQWAHQFGIYICLENPTGLRVIEDDSSSPLFAMVDLSGLPWVDSLGARKLRTAKQIAQAFELCLESRLTAGVLSALLSQTVGAWAFEVQCSREKKWLVNVYGEAKTGEHNSAGEAIAEALLMIWGE